MHSAQEVISSCATVVEYKPSGFYFRRGLRAASDAMQVVQILDSLRDEFDLSLAFAREHGVKHAPVSDRRPRLPSDVDKLRSLGLALCCELEALRQAIRAVGVTPPKKNIMRSEAEDKGWFADPR